MAKEECVQVWECEVGGIRAKADSQNFLLQLEGNSWLLLWESMDKWDERMKEGNMDDSLMVVNLGIWVKMPQ